MVIKRILGVLILLLVFVSPVYGETQEPVLKDALAQSSGAEGWIWAMRYWSPPAPARDLAGGRVQAILGVGRWGFAARGDASGLPGEFATDKLQTFRTLEVHLSAHRNLLGVNGVQVGPAVGTGLALALEQGPDGLPPKTPNNFSYGAGMRIAGKGWWAYLMAGQHQALPGFAAITTYQVKMNERTAMVGTFAYGGQQKYIAQMGVAIKWFDRY
jgi:hypothetical protein